MKTEPNGLHYSTSLREQVLVLMNGQVSRRSGHIVSASDSHIFFDSNAFIAEGKLTPETLKSLPHLADDQREGVIPWAAVILSIAYPKLYSITCYTRLPSKHE